MRLATLLLNPPETFPGACSPTDATSPGEPRPGVPRGQVSKDRPCPQLQGTEPHTPVLTPSPCSLSPCLPVPHPQPSTWSVSLVPAAHTAHTQHIIHGTMGPHPTPVSFPPKVKHKGFDESMFPEAWLLGSCWGRSWGTSLPPPLGWLPYPDRSGPGYLLQTKAGSCPDQ